LVKILASIIFLSLATLAFANETMDALANAAARFSAAIEQQLAIVQNEPVTADFAERSYMRNKNGLFRSSAGRDVMLGILPDLDWTEIASEGESEEVRKAQAELDAVLSEIDRRKGRLVSLEKLVAEGSFSRSLFEALDAEKLSLGDLSAREETPAGALSEARSKAAALHAPHELIEAIRSDTRPELRLRLKSEIRKRIGRIDLLFPGYAGWNYFAILRFANGARRIVGVRGGFAYCGTALPTELGDRFFELLREINPDKAREGLPAGTIGNAPHHVAKIGEIG
jgi:hypothetical protein